MTRPYWRLEWYGWRFYWHHFVAVTRAIWIGELRPLRAGLSLISIGLGAGLMLVPNLYMNPGFEYLAKWIPQHALGACFLLHGVGMTWRNYAPARVAAWGFAFAILGMTLFFGYPLAFTLAIKRLTPAAIVLFIIGLLNAWCGRRVGSGEDRAGA